MDDVNNNTTNEEQLVNVSEIDIDNLTEEQKKTIAEQLKVKFYAENKSLKDFKAKILAEKEQAEKLALEEQGKFKELAETHEKKLITYKKKLAVNSLKDVLLEKNVSKGALNLIIQAYQNKLEIDENDEVTNLDAIVEELEATSPEVFNFKTKNILNTPSNPVVTSNKPMPYSEWMKLSSDEKLLVKNERGIDYQK